MPLQCGSSVLTGQDGSIWFKPAGTTACLKDFTDFPAGAEGIILPETSDFKVGDKVKFRIEGSAVLDTALNQSNVYTIGGKVGTKTKIFSAGGTIITLNGDGGLAPDAKGPILTFGAITAGSGYTNGIYTNVELVTNTGVGAGGRATITVSGGAVTAVALVAGSTKTGDGYAVGNSLTADFNDIGGTGSGFAVAVGTIENIRDDSPGGHINVSYDEFEAVCNVSNFDLNLTRARIDITSLPCNFTTAAASKFAPFRSYQPGFADGSGTMTVKFSRDQTALASRLLSNSLLRVQDGATARLFIDTVVGTSGAIDLDQSSYIEVALSIEGMQFSVTTEDSPTEATINFSFQSNPTHVFYTDLVA
jgi:hypothetical protein